MTWMARLKILPLLVVVAALSFGVRFTEFVTGVSNAPGSANAQQEDVMPAQSEGNKDVIKDAMMAETEASKAMESPNEIGGATQADATDLPNMEDSEEIKWRDSEETEFESSEIKIEMFKDLQDRRKELESQERELSVREALLKTAEQEIDQKYQELVSLKAEIEDLLVQQSEEEAKRTASLVKIYEGMKPKDAARIFNTLDLDILLNVVSRMSERKSAPIIASMDSGRARTLTQMLMDQKTLGSMSPKIN